LLGAKIQKLIDLEKINLLCKRFHYKAVLSMEINTQHFKEYLVHSSKLLFNNNLTAINF